MKIEHLRSFHMIALTGSFTSAARDLFLTQPAVSQQIQQLEHGLGIRLFDRLGKTVALTSEGQILFSHTARLFKIYDEIATLFEQLNDLATGRITIGSTAVIGTYFLPRIIEGYGITIIPEISIRRELHVGLLKRINLEGLDLTFNYYLFYKKKKHFSKATAAFLDMLTNLRLLSDTENLSAHLSNLL